MGLNIPKHLIGISSTSQQKLHVVSFTELELFGMAAIWKMLAPKANTQRLKSWETSTNEQRKTLIWSDDWLSE